MGDARLDELFGEEGGQPEPRRRLILTLIGSGLLLTTVGMACSAVPGGLVVLAAWLVVEKDIERVESGYLPSDAGPEVRRLRALALGAVIAVLVMFTVQWALLQVGFYDALWASALARMFGRDIIE